MRREPPSHQRRVALACVHVVCVIGVLTVTVNNVFAVELVAFSKRIVRAKSVGIDSERLLLAVSQQEPNRRFVCGFRRHNVPLIGATIYEDENTGGLSCSYVPRPRRARPRERDQRSRSRPFRPAET